MKIQRVGGFAEPLDEFASAGEVTRDMPFEVRDGVAASGQYGDAIAGLAQSNDRIVEHARIVLVYEEEDGAFLVGWLNWHLAVRELSGDRGDAPRAAMRGT